jgi:hypothetical protein
VRQKSGDYTCCPRHSDSRLVPAGGGGALRLSGREKKDNKISCDNLDHGFGLSYLFSWQNWQSLQYKETKLDDRKIHYVVINAGRKKCTPVFQFEIQKRVHVALGKIKVSSLLYG